MKLLARAPLGVALLALAGVAAAQQSYTGAAACVSCHDRQGSWLQGSVHEKAPAKESEEPGCEACHGAGSRHLESPAVDTIITFRIEEAGLRSARCLRCHEAVRTGRHRSEQVGCNDCHAGANSEGFHRLRAGQAASQVLSRACRRCHKTLSASHDPKQSRHQECLGCHRGFHGPTAGRRGGTLR